MTKVNDYLWHLPHTPAMDDPPDVIALQQSFNLPLTDALESPLAELGYELRISDIAVHLDTKPEAGRRNTYRANIRFIHYLQPDVIARIHIEHTEWASFLMSSDNHTFFINLDRFKVADTYTQVAIPAWPGRLHTRLSNLPGDALHHDGEDQLWQFSSAAELEQLTELFLDKFTRLGKPWLEDYSTF